MAEAVKCPRCGSTRAWKTGAFDVKTPDGNRRERTWFECGECGARFPVDRPAP